MEGRKRLKILLLGFAKYRYMPYANFYLDCIDKQKNEVHMVIWNRDLMAEKLPDNVIIHELRLKQEDQISPLKKIASFIKYRNFAKDVINKIRPDFVIVLHTLPGILLQNKLVSAYKGKFIFDYRDSTYESNGLFKKMVARLVEASGATFVSSDGFRRFLPDSAKEKTFTSHNISVSDIDSEVRAKDKHFPIRVGCWGLLREEHLNKCIIRHLANDNRFELHYYGREQQIAVELKEYAKTLNATNVFFHGEYIPKERKGFAENTDILHNISSTGNMLLAMSNRVYDGMLFHIPQICMSNSFMGEMVKINSIGTMLNPETDSFADDLENYYKQLDLEQFDIAATNTLEKVYNEYLQDQRIINELIHG